MLCGIHLGSLFAYLVLCLANLFVAEFNLEGEIFDFFCQGVILAVILNVIELRVIPVKTCLSLKDLCFLLRDGLLELIYIHSEIFESCGESFYFVFKVLHLKRQFAAQCPFLINTCEGGLQLIESFEFLFYRQVCRIIFLCHN